MFVAGRFLTALLLVLFTLAPVAGRAEGAAELPDHPGLIEETTLLNVSGAGTDGYRLEVAIVRPAAAKGRLPIALLTHGKPRFAKEMLAARAGMFAPQARDLAHRGYLAVVVIRRGYGRSDGTPGKASNAQFARCSHEDLRNYFSVESDDLAAALRAIAERPDADGTRVIVIGGSVGGGAALAFAARNPPGLRAVVNLAGATRLTDAKGSLVCPLDVPIGALASFGAQTKIPSLWVYSANDSVYGPDMARKLHAAYVAQGGVATLRIAPPLPEDGHHVFERVEGRQQWLAALDPFLRAHGLPTWSPQDLEAVARDFKVPANSRERLEQFFSLYTPRVLLQAPAGWLASMASTHGLAPARAEGLARCQKAAKGQACRVIMENFTVTTASAAPQASPPPGPPQSGPQSVPPQSAPQPAPPQSVSETAAAVFAQAGLIGLFSPDCSQPVTPKNHIIAHRPLPGGTVQRELWIDPKKRQYSYSVDRARTLSSGDVEASMSNERGRLTMVLRAQDGRMRTMESATGAGVKVVTGGMFVQNGNPAPWYQRCR